MSIGCLFGFHSVYTDVIHESVEIDGHMLVHTAEMWERCNNCNWYEKRLL